ncbi:hypothetical protein BESB_010170 [Besnoitia besnoiti]|uniref:Uncharacterized protein n=1 Tax=Besnoitia besnoiti TaxID=94643 RepID=A0A2A9MKZ1_BESBE|nr:hypothetical protein BESB_010170 [Besnoitia besnoiti]PFH38675.1 hypothetical protein BESB_010170 [Besnoitia besnoiti]
MLVCPSSLFPYAPTLPWPKKERLQRGDLLRDVLSAGTLRVAGVGSTAVSLGPMTIVAAQNRGEEGNYSSPEPTGFFPQYMRMIAGIIGSHYGSTVTVQWLFYPSVEEAQQAVLRGQAHMTDIYFLLGQSTPGEPQPLMDFYATCPVVGSPALLILREDQVAENPGAPGMPAKQPATNSASSLDKHALLNLNRRIDNTSDERERKVVFVSRDLANTVQHSLSPKALLHFAADLDSAISMVRDGHAAAVFTTGVVPPLSPPMTVVNAHLLLAKGAWIERTHALECMEEEHENGLTAYAQEKASEGTSKLESAHAPEAISSVTLSLIFGGVIAVSSAVAF